MRYSKEELEKLIEQAPRDEKNRPVISDEDFMDNLDILPDGVRSDQNKFSKDGGYVQAGRKGDPKTLENVRKAQKASYEAYQKRKTIAETLDIFLKKTDENGLSNQDKIVMAMIAKANDGCVGAFEALRDTVGEKPSDNLNLDVMTEMDRELVANIQARLNELKGTKG